MANCKIADGMIFLANEGMVIDTRSNRIRKYNHTGVRILSVLNSGCANTVIDITRQLNANSDENQETFPEEYVSEFLASLEVSGVVVRCSSSDSPVEA